MVDYTLSNDNPATAETFNPIFADITSRIARLEQAGSALNQAKEEIVELGLARINPIVAQALQSIENVAELSDLFRAKSDSSVEIGAGVHEFIINTDDRALFAAPLYVAISVNGELDKWMAGQVQSWNKETGQLFVDITHTRGEGVFADWIITPTHIPENGPSIDAYNKSEADAAINAAAGDIEVSLLGGVGVAHNTLQKLATSVTSLESQKEDKSALKILAKLDTVGAAQIDANSITNAHMTDSAENVTGVDWDTVVKNGFYMGSNTTNNPLGSNARWWIGQHIAHNSDYGVQKLLDFTGDHLEYIRCLDNGVWGSWVLASATPIMIVQDEKSSGTPGGTFTSGADRQRTLNTVVYNSIPNATLSGNKVYLGPGAYEFHGRAPAHRVDEHAVHIRSSSGQKWRGRSMRSYSAIYNPTVSEVNCVVQDNLSRSYDLMHRCSATYATDGFGWDHSFGFNNIYSMLTIRKLA